MSSDNPKVFLAVGLPASFVLALSLHSWLWIPVNWTEQGWDVGMLALGIAVSVIALTIFQLLKKAHDFYPAIKLSAGWLVLGVVVHWAYSFGRFQLSLALGLEVDCAVPIPNAIESVSNYIVGPLAEESVFRALGVGAVMSLRHRSATAIAVFTSALLFAASHHWYGDLQSLIPIFEAGVVYGLLFSATAKLWPVALLHSVDNLLTLATEVALHAHGVPWCEV